MEREHGRIVSVSTETVGSTLTADVAAGVTVLPVFDCAPFDAENGGSVSVGGSVLAYSTSDDDASTVTLTDPLPAAASDGDRVDCWNPLYQAPFTVKTAMVQLDGDDDNPDPIEATVPHFLADKLADGDRGGPGESVTIKYDEDEDEWVIADVHGLAGASGAGEKHCNTDTFTVTAAGDQTIQLSHEPLPGSLEVVWHPDGLGGIVLTSAEWSLDGSTLSAPDPDGLLVVGDLLDPLYDYRDGPVTPPVNDQITVKAIYNVIRDDPNALVTVVGQPPWGDDNDATYADLQAKYDTGVGSIGVGHTYLPAAPGVDSMVDTAAISVRIKMQALNGDSLPLPNFSIQLPDGTDLMTGGGSDTSPTTVEWVSIPLSGSREADVLTALTTDQGARLHFSAPFIFSGTMHTWRIFEAQVVIG